MQTLKEAFGEQIKNYRKNRGYTQESLAKLLKISPRQLCRVESGENFVSGEVLLKLSLSLNIDLQNLFTFDWDKDLTLLEDSNDTSGFKAVRNGNLIDIKPLISRRKGREILHENLEDTDSTMLEMAQRQNKTLTVQYYDKNKRSNIKTYYPDGRIEIVLSKEQIEAQKIENYINKKITMMSKDKKKLTFIKQAISLLENGHVADEFNLIIRGIELAQSFIK